MDHIRQNVARLLSEIPSSIEVVAAAKGRTPEEIEQVIEAGITIVGHNYAQEALKSIEHIGKKARWHFIGHLQKNKVKHAVLYFDMIETVDSLELAQQIEKYANTHNKIMDILIEINSGREPQKSGAFPEDTYQLIEEIKCLPHLRLKGLMTMGKITDDLNEIRKCFRETRTLFDEINVTNIPGIEMKHLSMGMSDSYRIALEEGATMIRIGTMIFGPRP